MIDVLLLLVAIQRNDDKEALAPMSTFATLQMSMIEINSAQECRPRCE